MKKLFLFFFASLLSISMFAETPTYSGKTKAQAIPYNWNTGLHVSSEAGVGKWYVVKLKKQDGGPFKENGTTDEGLTNINVSVVNPLDEEADIDVIAYIGDNETNRHFKLAAGGIKSMTFGAGMFIKMGIDRVYLYLVMDVTITPEEAAQHEAVNVKVTPVESENTVVFNPIDFNWTGWPSQTTGVVIPANTETWVKVDFTQHSGLEDGKTYKFYVDKTGAGSTTLHAGLSYDCPATNIQTQDKVLTANTSKILDDAKLSILPDVVYVRLKADQELHIYAEQVALPQPGAQPIFNIKNGNNGDPAIEVLTGTVYKLEQGKQVYFVKRGTLKAAEEYHYKQIEVTNDGDEEVTIIGKASKNPDGNGNVWSVVSKSVTIPAHQTYVKKIDKSMQNVVGTTDDAEIWAQGPLNPNITFKLTEVPEDPDYCQPTQAEVLTLTATGQVVKAQSAGTQWYKVDITKAMTAKTDITLTLESDQEVNITIDVAAACALGEPTQTYTGKSRSTIKTLSYSVIKDVKKATDDHYYVFVRVRTDKDIRVKAELQTTKTWNGTEWTPAGDPTINDAARIEGNLTIANGQTIKALGITLTSIPETDPVQYYTITIENGGKLIVGKEGIKGSQAVDQIIIKKGGIILIDPAATTNNQPFVTVENTLKLGVQSATGHTLPEWHNFIALPIENREASFASALYYAHWDRMNGWVSTDGFRHPFVGYNVFALNGDYYQNPAQEQTVSYQGQLASNKNVTLSLPQNGWYAFGNSWTAPIPLSSIYSQLSGSNDDAAVHFYVDAPTDYSNVNLGTILDNYYIAATQEIASNLGISNIKPMQGFFLHTETSKSVTLDYNALYNDHKSAAPKRAEDNRNMVAAVLSNSVASDFVYMIEGEAGNASKMIGDKIAIYVENGLAQIANDNLIGTILTIKTTEDTEYTLHFAWLKGEIMYLKDLVNGNIIAMTENTRYTFTAEPNTISERFQVIGRNEAPTAIENNAAIDGANKRIENGKIVIIKNGVKYDVLGTQL